MSKNLFARAVQDAASESEDGPSSFRGTGTCHEVAIFWRMKWDIILTYIPDYLHVVFGHLVLINTFDHLFNSFRLKLSVSY